MKKLYLLCALLGALCVQSLSAQVIKGDMNDDGVFNITDVSESVNTVLGKRAIQYVQGGDPYMVDNSRVVGTWYKTKSDHFTLNEDGTTDYSGASTFRFLPYQGCIMFFDSSSRPVTFIDVRVLEDGYMVCIPRRTDALTVLTTEVPAQPVTAIQLSSTSLEMQPNEFKPMLTATVLPADADNKAVTWSSSNESVVKLSGDLILAMGYGTATITCSATDGSGVKAECTVTVKNKVVTHEYVDLGLPGGVLWATCNVGADKPEDYGLYFAWGETTGYAKGESHSFDMNNYSYKEDRDFDAAHDAATANWGAGWRMPTKKEQDDLRNSAYCTWTWKDNYNGSGVNGYEVKSNSNGNTIFFPAAGYRDDKKLSGESFGGMYGSSSLDPSYSDYAFILSFGSGEASMKNDFYRYYGRSVRAVRK